MTVYLLHFDQPIPRGLSPNGKPLTCGHYLGYADDLDTRLAKHKAGNGARLMSVLNERGIGWVIGRIWPDGDRTLESKLKRQKNAPRLCNLCRDEALARKNSRRRR